MSVKTIIVTRPSGQARQLIETLSHHIENSGVAKRTFPEILSLPLLTIAPRTDEHLADQIATALSNADLAIFVSPNAIESVMRLLERDWQDFSTKIIPIGVMGGSSQLALKNHGIGLERNPTPVIMPSDNEHWDSEGLWHELQSLEWSWKDKKVVIFKGEGGRDWLADTLKKAGASVDAISTYVRIPLDIDNQEHFGYLLPQRRFATWVKSSKINLRKRSMLLAHYVRITILQMPRKSLVLGKYLLRSLEMRL
jgi:uroporphyrinogen-III synthase